MASSVANSGVFAGHTTTLMPIEETSAAPVARPRLVPLWRHAVWFVALFVVSAVAVSVRLDVQQLRKDLDRHARMDTEARVLNERLRLERDSRRRAVAVEAIAQSMGVDQEVHVVRIEEAP